MAGVPIAFPTLVVPAILGGALVLTLGIAIALWGRDLALPKLVPMWTVKIEARDHLPFRLLVPLNAAVRTAYDGLQDSVVGGAARTLGTSPENYIYHALRLHDLWGTRPGASRLVRIGTGFIANAVFDVKANTLGTQDEIFENVQVLRRDLRLEMKRLKSWDSAFAENAAS